MERDLELTCLDEKRKIRNTKSETQNPFSDSLGFKNTIMDFLKGVRLIVCFFFLNLSRLDALNCLFLDFVLCYRQRCQLVMLLNILVS